MEATEMRRETGIQAVIERRMVEKRMEMETWTQRRMAKEMEMRRGTGKGLMTLMALELLMGIQMLKNQWLRTQLWSPLRAPVD